MEPLLLSTDLSAPTICGLRYDPMEPEASAAWASMLATRRDLTVVSAKDIWEGRMGGDACYLPDAFSLAMGVHPLREIHDWSMYDDNGNVVFYFGRGSISVPPETAVAVLGNYPSVPHRSLPVPTVPPPRIDLDGRRDGNIQDIVPHPERGEFLIVDWGVFSLVCWRHNSNFTKGLAVVGCHGSPEFARIAIRTRYEGEFDLPEARRNRGNRDYQRGLVYDWQPDLLSEAMSEAEAQNLVDAIFADAGVPRPPKVSVSAQRVKTSAAVGLSEIRLAEGWGQDRRVVVHEAAHILAKRAAPGLIAGHGPEFVGVFIRLLEQWCGMDATELIASADKMGVDHVAPDWMPSSPPPPGSRL